ncbi:MAG: hypothetical protein V4618_13385 [Pseudomonadota bacterium]
MNAHSSIFAMAAAQHEQSRQTWDEAYAAYRRAQAAQRQALAELPQGEDVPDEVSSMDSEAFNNVMMIPAPTLDALAIKLALYAADDGHGLSGAAVFQARMAADGLALAHQLSGSPQIREVAAATFSETRALIAYPGVEGDNRQKVATIFEEVANQLANDSQPTPPSAVEKAFGAWRDAKLVGYYAQPCPDEIMNRLSENEIALERVLAATPAVSHRDIVLKLLPIALVEHSPDANRPPLLPVVKREGGSDYAEDACWEGVIRDMIAAEPQIAICTKMPASDYYLRRDSSKSVAAAPTPIQAAIAHWSASHRLAHAEPELAPDEEKAEFRRREAIADQILTSPITCSADAAAKLRVALSYAEQSAAVEGVITGVDEADEVLLSDFGPADRQVYAIIRELEGLDA